MKENTSTLFSFLFLFLFLPRASFPRDSDLFSALIPKEEEEEEEEEEEARVGGKSG